MLLTDQALIRVFIVGTDDEVLLVILCRPFVQVPLYHTIFYMFVIMIIQLHFTVIFSVLSIVKKQT